MRWLGTRPSEARALSHWYWPPPPQIEMENCLWAANTYSESRLLMDFPFPSRGLQRIYMQRTRRCLCGLFSLSCGLSLSSRRVTPISSNWAICTQPVSVFYIGVLLARTNTPRCTPNQRWWKTRGVLLPLLVWIKPIVKCEIVRVSLAWRLMQSLCVHYCCSNKRSSKIVFGERCKVQTHFSFYAGCFQGIKLPRYAISMQKLILSNSTSNKIYGE
jgi:hypothetical protein